MFAVWFILVAVLVTVVAITAFDMGYQRGHDDGSATVYADARRSLFRALRERFSDPLMSSEARDGAWQTVRQAVRRE